MPKDVINEVIFRNVSPEQRAAILAKVGGEKSPVDFEVLLPLPLNVWWGSVGTKHEKRFPGNALDWCRENWSTKWNAYGISEGGRYESVAQTDDTLTLTFQTAWGPPMGWLVALFNTLRLPFEYRFLSEGSDTGGRGTFAPDDGSMGDKWDETETDEALTRHLHKLLWGVEEFEPEPDEVAS